MHLLLAGYSRTLPVFVAICHQYFSPLWPTGTYVANSFSPFVATNSVRQWMPWPTQAWTGQLIRRAPKKTGTLSSPKRTPAAASGSANATSTAGAWPG